MPPLSDEALLTELAGALADPGPMPDGLDAACKALFPVVPLKVTVVRHKCRFCRYTRAKAAPVADHMTRCWKNPAVKACKTCAFFQPGNGLGSAAYCQPGEQCSCGVVEEGCTHADGPDPFEGIVMGCPLWRLRGSVEADGGDVA